MDHRQLEIFLVTAERLSLSRAAEALDITQPGLSKSLQRLQNELGTKLYQRRGRGIALTEAGRALFKHSRVIEAQMAQARSELSGIATGMVGHVRIGAGPSWLSRHLPDAISRIIARKPNVQFMVETSFPDRLMGRLRQGELDIVIGALPENRHDPDLRFQRLTRDVNRVAGRADHPLTRKRDRTLADFAAQSWILPGRQEQVRKRLERAFKSAKLPEPVVAVETDSLSLTLATLRTTDCLGLMTSQILSQPEAHGLALIDTEPLRFRREAGIISRAQDDRSPSVRLIIAELRSISQQGTN
jgi:LysR family transcriptional regulator of gallate degradation